MLLSSRASWEQGSPLTEVDISAHGRDPQVGHGVTFHCRRDPPDQPPHDMLILVIPGGSYARIARGDTTHFIEEMGRRRPATAFAVVPYATPPSSPWQPLEDVQRAFETVVGAARAHPGNPGASLLHRSCHIRPGFLVGLAGFSAGGHVACTLAQHVTVEFLILVYPVVTMVEKYAHRRSKANLLARELVGRPPDVQRRVMRMFSAELHVERFPLKIYLATSRNDQTVSWRNAALLYRALYARQDAHWANMSDRRPRRHYEPQLSLVVLKVYPYGVHGHFGDNTTTTSSTTAAPGMEHVTLPADPEKQEMAAAAIRVGGHAQWTASRRYVEDMLPWLAKVAGGYDADTATLQPDTPMG